MQKGNTTNVPGLFRDGSGLDRSGPSEERSLNVEESDECRRTRVRRADPAHVRLAMRLLAYEREGTPVTSAVAAAVICRKLHLHLALLLGTVSVDLLLTRSLRVTHAIYPGLVGVTFVDGATTLPDVLTAKSADGAAECAAALFGAFFTLLVTFIGERLTTQVLLGKALPDIDLTTESTSRDRT